MKTGEHSGVVRDTLIASGPVTLAVLLGVLPIAILLVESVTPGPSIENYVVATTPLYRTSLTYSLGMGVVATVTCLVVAYPVTYWLAHRCPAGIRLPALVALTLPLWLNYVVLNYTWVWILARGGILNRLLVATGIIGEPLGVLFTDLSVFIGFVYIYLPYVVLTLYVSMERLDGRLIEAARDLGATNRRVVVDVVFPQTFPGAVAGAIVVYARIAGAYTTPEILGGPGDVMIATLVVEAFEQFSDFGLAAALSVVFLSVVVAGFALGTRVPSVGRELKRW